MKIYRVGGAVRDKLLGYPWTENDWVVVGSSPQELEALGYIPVGKDFPVFLHPQTREEYALARTERKSGHGYGGFTFYCGTDVTLEDDLQRRDLTINAMAEDDQGQIIDPYGGQQDIEARILRHVSPAFSEDPLRILRVARFAARYRHLGFTVAEETLELMRAIVAAGEIEHLVRERIWKETERALGECSPEVFVQVLRDCHALARLMPELNQLFGIPQNPESHPEVDTGVHSLLCLQQAAQLSGDTQVRFATLIHDLGKAVTPQDQWPHHPGHEQASLPLIKQLCERIGAPREYRELALLVAEWHTACHRALLLEPQAILTMFKLADVFRRPARWEKFLLCCEADSRGRTGFEEQDYPQANYLRAALQDCQTINLQDIAAQGFTGKAFGEELDRRRLQKLTAFKQNTRKNNDR
jgi:tRNA nucleotidyltransferase (CCA-adding enzyme)